MAFFGMPHRLQEMRSMAVSIKHLKELDYA
jgi:hypothetical protein